MISNLIIKELYKNKNELMLKAIALSIIFSISIVSAFFYYNIRNGFDEMSLHEQFYNINAEIDMTEIYSIVYDYDIAISYHYLEICNYMKIETKNNKEIAIDANGLIFIDDTANNFSKYLLSQVLNDSFTGDRNAPNANSIWISHYTSIYNNLNLGDIISISSSNQSKEFIISGIYSNNPLIEIPFIISNELIYSMLNAEKEIQIYIWSNNINDILTIIKSLENKNIEYIDELGIMEVINRFKVSKLILIIVLVVAVILFVTIFIRYYISYNKERFQFYKLLNFLGLPGTKFRLIGVGMFSIIYLIIVFLSLPISLIAIKNIISGISNYYLINIDYNFLLYIHLLKSVIVYAFMISVVEMYMIIGKLNKRKEQRES